MRRPDMEKQKRMLETCQREVEWSNVADCMGQHNNEYRNKAENQREGHGGSQPPSGNGVAMWQ